MPDQKNKLEKQEALPFPPTPSGSIAGRTMQESVYRPRATPRRLPADAPNILIVLIDDAGPALPATFGGEVLTPTMDRIVNDGIAYNRFHTTAMCSPTRAALLTGRNHHRVGNGQIAELANDWDGYSGVIPRSSALVAEVLKDYGYATGAWGKWHNTPAVETVPAGPFENWPTGLGFEYFYGFLAGEASQYEPNLVRNTTSVLPPKTVHEGYHLSEDLADDAIGWLRRHRAYQPDKPFFMYWASGAIHGPHHIAREWADKYKGKFDDGWDAYRERAFRRAKEKGWIPADAELTPRHETMPSWDSIPEDERPFQRRLMEVAAGFTEHVDVQVGRVVDEIDRLGYGDNTLIFYIWGDNGSSAEGQSGTISELLAQNGIPSSIRQHIDALAELGGLDELGSHKTDPMYHAGWAWAGSTPYKGTKLLASHFGGTRNPMAVRWPAKIKPDTVPRAQFHHVNDVVPTIYEILGITPPRTVNGIEQDLIDGVSFAYTFDDPQARGRLLTQVLRGHGQPQHLPRWLDGMRLRAANPVASGAAAGHPRMDPGSRRLGTLQPRGRLEPVQRPGRQHAREAGADEGTVPYRGGEEQGASNWRGPLDPGAASGNAGQPAVYRVDVLRRHGPHAGVLRAGPGQPAQRRHHRCRDPGERQRRALQVRRKLGRPHLLRGRRHPLLRIQPVHHPAHEDPRHRKAPEGQGEDLGRNALCRAQARRSAEGEHEGRRQDGGRRHRADQCAAAVYRQ